MDKLRKEGLPKGASFAKKEKHDMGKQQKEKIKILFICYGNICRSPMAEFVLKDMVQKKGMADRFWIASAATSSEEIFNGVGNPVYPPAREELDRQKVPHTPRQATQVKKEDYKAYDYLICMDMNNLQDLKKIVGEDGEKKISLLLDYTARPGTPIADPFFTRDFAVTYRDIKEGCEGLLKHILAGG